jgi:enoyl-CoA hydratase
MEQIRLVINDRIAVMTLCNEKALNAISVAMLREMDKALDSLQSAAVLVITGAGEKAFAAGADIAGMKDFTPEQASEYSRFGNGVFRRIETLSIPVIAAVNGYALGGGLELAMSADIRVMADSAVVGQPEASLGMTPGWGGTQRLSRLIGKAAAKYLLFTGESIKADRAYQLGLAQAVVPRAELMDTVIALAVKIAAMPEAALRCIKKTVDEGLELDMDKGLVMEANAYASCFETSDPTRLMTAFLERRRK